MTQRASGSVLSLPLGGGSVLARLLADLAGHRHRPTLVVSNAEAARFERILSPAEFAAIQVVTPAKLAEVVDACEASDWLLIVPVRYWPSGGHDFGGLVRAAMRFRGATHAVALPASAYAAREQILCDPSGQVRCVRRLYDAMSWPRRPRHGCSARSYPRIPWAATTCAPASLRNRLAASGVLTQDIPRSCDVYDLAKPGGILLLTERAVEHAANAAGRRLPVALAGGAGRCG